MKDDSAVYDFQKQNRARTTGTLRAIASGYLIYLAWTIIRDLLNGSSTLPGWVGWLAAVVFAFGGAAFGVYAWRTYRRDLEAARLPEEEETREEATEKTEEGPYED